MGNCEKRKQFSLNLYKYSKIHTNLKSTFLFIAVQVRDIQTVHSGIAKGGKGGTLPWYHALKVS